MIEFMKKMFVALSLLSIFHMEARSAEETSQYEGGKSYGGAQGNSIFQKRSEKVIDLASVQIGKLIEFAQKKGRDLSSLHDAFLGSKESQKGLAHQRWQIARDTKTKNAEHFGSLRNSPLTPPLHKTPVTGNWHHNFFSYYSKFLKENINHLKIGETFFWETPDKVNCCMIDVMPRNKWALPGEMPNTVTTDEQIKVYISEAASYKALGTFYPDTDPEKKRRFEELVNQDNKLMAITFILNSHIEGRDVDLTQFYTWIETDLQTPNGLSIENIDKIQTLSNVIARHTEKTDIPFVLNKASKLWAQAILGSSNNKDFLIQNLGEYAYLMSHAMPFCRGSAAIMEWSIKSICRFHSLNFSYEGVLDQDALLSPFPREFLEYFKNHVTLEAI